MVCWVEITQLSSKVSSVYDSAKQEWIVETTTRVIHIIHLRSKVTNNPQQPVINIIDIEQQQPKEQLSPEVINISSNSEMEEGVHEDVRKIGFVEEEEQKQEAAMPPRPIVGYISYSSVSAPRRVLSHPTQRFRKYTRRKRVGGGILVQQFVRH
ncbi:hypothetical protein PIB30_038412 [Stylosanthes scabra]|uniref:Uncharacterized protein n=1 Tax=Stylosanthes scabra TaxID=79078 RepID=A0ABU6VCS4_9FABA|nr:hypothetical protein [Stylosanthes scabra]